MGRKAGYGQHYQNYDGAADLGTTGTGRSVCGEFPGDYGGRNLHGADRRRRSDAADLAAGMLLASGNDAANAAAVRIAGTQADFVMMMNRRAAQLGMTDTCFETPSGLDGQNHYSTARIWRYWQGSIGKRGFQGNLFLRKHELTYGIRLPTDGFLIIIGCWKNTRDVSGSRPDSPKKQAAAW